MRFFKLFSGVLLALGLVGLSSAEARKKCPPGFTPKAVGGGNLQCQKHIWSKARFHGKAGCRPGTFADLSYKTTCFRCPRGYKRSIHHVKSGKACVRHTGFLKYSFRRARSFGKNVCRGRKFFDPRKGGECWACPVGFTRQTAAVTSDKACLKILRVKPKACICQPGLEQCIHGACRRHFSLRPGERCTNNRNQCRRGSVCLHWTCVQLGTLRRGARCTHTNQCRRGRRCFKGRCR